MTILAGVIGDPISHSRSPRLHGHWLRRYGIDGAYVPLHIRPDDLAEALKLLPRMGFVGANVTIPHKEDVFHLADERTARAEAVEAANTLVFKDGRIIADNTDGLGFLASLQQGAPGWSPSEPAFVLGAGGAARGVIAALLDSGVPRVTLANRTKARADGLGALFGSTVSTVEWAKIHEKLGGHGLLVNTTSLGMTGGAPLDLALENLASGTVVTDIVYTPLQTPLLKSAAARGNPTVDGLGMLLHQAVPGFTAWFGVEPVVDEALRQAVLS